MKKDAYLGMHPGDLDGKPYAKYWNPDMQGLSPAVQQGLLQSPLPRCEGFDYRDCNRLLEPGYLPIESGFTQLPSGEMFVAVNTPLPGATGEMIDWWFGWHSLEVVRWPDPGPRHGRSLRYGNDPPGEIRAGALC